MDLDVNSRWALFEEQVQEHFGKQMNLESILFFIGVRELGERPRPFTKEEKVDLMHIAICRLLSQSGYYKLSHLDQDGWPHWDLLKPLPHQDIFSQEYLLREHILVYADEESLFQE
ncbi:MAG: hypothetical protein R8P61_01195 [Bacteroidia bacterium]|nr:hypothetical protein [Bacteroidia bacterium]